MGTLLQVQEAGSSATNAISQMGQAAQQQNSGQPNQYHPFANAFTQLLQNIDQATGNVFSASGIECRVASTPTVASCSSR